MRTAPSTRSLSPITLFLHVRPYSPHAAATSRLAVLLDQRSAQYFAPSRRRQQPHQQTLTPTETPLSSRPKSLEDAYIRSTPSPRYDFRIYGRFNTLYAHLTVAWTQLESEYHARHAFAGLACDRRPPHCTQTPRQSYSQPQYKHQRTSTFSHWPSGVHPGGIWGDQRDLSLFATPWSTWERFHRY